MRELISINLESLKTVLRSCDFESRINFLVSNWGIARLQEIKDCLSDKNELRVYRLCTTSSYNVVNKLNFTEQEIFKYLDINPTLVAKFAEPTEQMLDFLKRPDIILSNKFENWICDNFYLVKDREDIITNIICRGSYKLAQKTHREMVELSVDNQRKILSNLHSLGAIALYNLDKDIQFDLWLSAGKEYKDFHRCVATSYSINQMGGEKHEIILRTVNFTSNRNLWGNLTKEEIENFCVSLISDQLLTVEQAREIGVNISPTQAILTQI